MRQKSRRFEILVHVESQGHKGSRKSRKQSFRKRSLFLGPHTQQARFRTGTGRTGMYQHLLLVHPPSLRNKKNDPDYKEKLHKVAPKMKEKMMKEGTMMVTYQAQHDLPNFFRIVFQNSGLEKVICSTWWKSWKGWERIFELLHPVPLN